MKKLVGCGLVWLAFAAGSPAWGAGQHGGVGRTTASTGYLGIDVRDVSDDELSVLKLKDTHGAEIIRVDHDGPAGKMGLREHDVVVQMNGMAIESEEQIRRMLREIAPGHTVALVICREGREFTLTAQMADRTEVERQAWELHLSGPSAGSPQAPPTGLPSEDPPASGGPAASSTASAASRYGKSFLGTILMTPAYTGVMLERMGPQLADFFGVPKGAGLLIKSVDNNSPASMAGLRAGDVMIRANQRTLSSLTEWTKAVRDAKGRPLSVTVLRDRGEKTFTVTPDAKKHSELEMPEPWTTGAESVQVARLTEL